jgi:hypothetical protein
MLTLVVLPATNLLSSMILLKIRYGGMVQKFLVQAIARCQKKHGMYSMIYLPKIWVIMTSILPMDMRAPTTIRECLYVLFLKLPSKVIFVKICLLKTLNITPKTKPVKRSSQQAHNEKYNKRDCHLLAVFLHE